MYPNNFLDVKNHILLSYNRVLPRLLQREGNTQLRLVLYCNSCEVVTFRVGKVRFG